MPDAGAFRVLVVEDEPLGFRRLAEILQRQPDVEVAGWAQDVESAVESIRSLRPNAVFLDVHMPDGTGLDVVETVGPDAMPPTVFVTAYDRYAVDAFRLAAVDYLLKPYTDERVEESLHRLRTIRAAGDLQTLTNELRLLLGASAGARSNPSPAGSYLRRIAVETRGRMQAVPVEKIDRIDAQGVYAELHIGADRHLIREPIHKLEAMLDPVQFCRVHRSHIVRLDFVESYNRGGGSYFVRTRSGDDVPVGRSFRKELERRLGCL